jgi:hypothetical protein
LEDSSSKSTSRYHIALSFVSLFLKLSSLISLIFIGALLILVFHLQFS